MRGCWSTAYVPPLTQILASLPDVEPESLTLSNEPRGGEKRASELFGSTLQALGITYVLH